MVDPACLSLNGSEQPDTRVSVEKPSPEFWGRLCSLVCLLPQLQSELLLQGLEAALALLSERNETEV